MNFGTRISDFLAIGTGAGDSVSLLENITTYRLLVMGLMLLALILFLRALRHAAETLGRRAPRARFFFNTVSTLLRFLVWIGAFLLSLYLFTPTREALLAIVASFGIALGLGAQDLVKSLIGGLVILTNRPFQLGDRVKIGEAYGEIDQIGLVSTKLTTPDDTRVTIPNSEILGGQVWNSNSGVPDCQAVTDLCLPHHADPALLLVIGREAAFSSPYTLLSKPVSVLLLDRFQDSPYQILRIKAYVYDHRFENLMISDLTVRVKSELRRLKIIGPRAWATGGCYPPRPESNPPPGVGESGRKSFSG